MARLACQPASASRQHANYATVCKSEIGDDESATACFFPVVCTVLRLDFHRNFFTRFLFPLERRLRRVSWTRSYPKNPGENADC